jgi:glutamine amidotransferase
LIHIVDYGMGNLKSVGNALKHIGLVWKVADNPKELKDSKGIIIPGVGAFPSAMERIRATGFDEAINNEVNKGKNILGICLGMQILLSTGLEGVPTKGLDLIEGRVTKITGNIKIPHMGWNAVSFKDHPIAKGIPPKTQFYFVHSFIASDVPKDNILGLTNYEREFPSGVCKDNIIGLQFHPEKSGDFGIKILRNFGELII